MPLPILLNGARGRMGRVIAERAALADVVIASAVDLGDDPRASLASCAAILDFSFHEATLPLARLAAEAGLPMVIATTGHTAEERAAILSVTERIPLVWAGNYSTGITLLLHLVEVAAAALPASFAPEIVELHHRHKVDSPSGTAVNLQDAIRRARQLPAEAVCHGRDGLVGPRPEAQVGVHAVRGGDVVGEHTVYFLGEAERLAFTHVATNRSIFADGALRAVRWVVGRPPGLYDMRHVLHLIS